MPASIEQRGSAALSDTPYTLFASSGGRRAGRPYLCTLLAVLLGTGVHASKEALVPSEKSLEALVVAVAAPATDAVRGICGAAAPVCASAYGSVAAAATGAYGAAAPACAKACASVGAAASSASASLGSAAGAAYGSVSAAASSAYGSISATKVGSSVATAASTVASRAGPPLARVWRFLVNWKGLIFWRPGTS